MGVDPDHISNALRRVMRKLAGDEPVRESAWSPDSWIVYRWLTPRWWRCLLKGCTGWRNFWCRVWGHPCGVRWYRSYGLEPDMHCENCGEDLG